MQIQDAPVAETREETMVGPYSIQRRYNRDNGVHFVYLRGPDYLGSLPCQSEDHARRTYVHRLEWLKRRRGL